MQHRFLSGKDGDYIDYASIDENSDYDANDLINQDAEDAYFDSEEPLKLEF